MPFFLLSRDDDDELRLLTTKTLKTRQNALAELSRLTAEPGFDLWDTDVMLLDLDSGTPVLMVRPAEAGEAEAEDAVVGEDVYVAEADVEPPAEIPADEAEAFAEYVAPSAVESEVAGATESPAPEPEPESEPKAEPEPETEPEPGPAEAPATEVDDLREALERTTAAMAEEAQVAEPGAEPQAEPVAEKWPWDTAVASEPEPSPAEEPVVPEPEPEAAAAPVSGFLDDLEPITSPAGKAAPAPEAAAGPEPAAQAAPEELPAPEPEPEPEPEPVAPPAEVPAATETVDVYTCDDCVYVAACPNKGERLPKDCGSFQWK